MITKRKSLLDGSVSDHNDSSRQRFPRLSLDRGVIITGKASDAEAPWPPEGFPPQAAFPIALIDR
jgi:hypothetical protein